MPLTMLRGTCWLAALASTAWIASASAAIKGEQIEARMPTATSCADDKRVQLTLGIPSEYLRSPGDSSNSRILIPAPFRPGYDVVCISVAVGNPYQLLDWLENSNLQAAVLPGFAVDVLAWSDTKKFAQDYLVLNRSPFRSVRLTEHRYEFVYDDGSIRGKAAYKKLFDAVTKDTEVPRVLLPHHLSKAVTDLFSYAIAYVNGAGIAKGGREDFFDRLIKSITFQQPFEGHATATDGNFRYQPIVSAESAQANVDTIDSDVLLVRRQIVSSYSELQNIVEQAQRKESSTEDGVAFSLLDEASWSDSKALKSFREDNYTLHQSGAVTRRYFRFTIPELWGFLDAGAPAAGSVQDNQHLALVLTGGGVKSAYQTRLVEQLYQTGWLRNATGVTSHEQYDGKTQPVDYVIGTSGGALLGIFVSSLDDQVNSKLAQPGSTSLTTLLWGAAGKRINSWEIFPIWDMLRYGSIVWCFLWLLIVGAVAVHYGQKKNSYFRDLSWSQGVGSRSDDQRPWDWPIGSLPWVFLLLFAPIFVVVIARARGVEHIPELAGGLYLLMVLIAIDVDQRFSPTGAPFKFRELRPSLVSTILFSVGVTIIYFSLRYKWKSTTTIVGCEDWSRAIVWCMAGFTVLAFALHRLLANQKHVLVTESPRPLLVALVVGVAIILGGQIVLVSGMLLGKVAILELTTRFWLWATAATIVLAILAMVLAAQSHDGRPRYPMIAEAVSVMYGGHQTRDWRVGRRRLARFVIFGATGWLWWNLLAAPGFYGNCAAREYFDRISTDFLGYTGLSANSPSRAVPFVITATSLMKSQERYFLFPRAGDEEHSGISNETWFRLVADPRWLVVRSSSIQDLQNVAFASGSPFPVFSSHAVTLKPVLQNERFIDGGFAHNRPLDAARALGATKVLVLNSAPLETEVGDTGCFFGELTCNVTKLVPYLWERSQTEDNLSSMSMFVASIYPTPFVGRRWPSLTDFLAEEVDSLIDEANADATRRIGVVESWGAPKFEDSQLTVFDRPFFKQMVAPKS